MLGPASRCQPTRTTTNCRSVTGRTFDDTHWQRKRFKTLMPSSKPAWSRHPVQSEAARGERQRVRRDKGWGGVLATLWLPWLEKRGVGMSPYRVVRGSPPRVWGLRA